MSLLFPAGASPIEKSRQPAAGRASAALLLPDLNPLEPDRVSLELFDGRWVLAFGAASDNLGAGPVIIHGSRSRPSSPMKALQEVLRSDGSSKFFKHAGRIEWWSQPGHHHFHYLGFMTYELRSVNGYKRVRPAQKTGFCLMDDYDASDWDPDHNPPGKPPAPVFTENCRPDEPDALTVDEGISVGYGDYYNPLLEGQSIDLTDVPDARYYLVVRANKAKSIRESNYKNNGASIQLELSHPSGQGGPPAMTILAICRDSDRCPAG